VGDFFRILDGFFVGCILLYRFVVANEGCEGFARYKGICTSAHIRSCVGYVLCQVIGYFLPIFCVQGYQEGECIYLELGVQL
jgi:hypothetical protein